MTLEEQGRFCSVCAKTVVDFTKASDKEIIEHLKKDKNACGRFYKNQLSQDFVINKYNSNYWIIATATLFSFLGIGSQSTYSQVKQDTIKTVNKTYPKDDNKINPNLPHKVYGTVYDELGPISGVNISIKGTKINTVSDFDGKFEITARLGDILKFKYEGFKEQTVNVGTDFEYSVVLKTDFKGEYIVVGYIKKRTFFGRQIQKVRNWFR